LLIYGGENETMGNKQITTLVPVVQEAVKQAQRTNTVTERRTTPAEPEGISQIQTETARVDFRALLEQEFQRDQATLDQQNAMQRIAVKNGFSLSESSVRQVDDLTIITPTDSRDVVYLRDGQEVARGIVEGDYQNIRVSADGIQVDRPVAPRTTTGIIAEITQRGEALNTVFKNYCYFSGTLHGVGLLAAEILTLDRERNWQRREVPWSVGHDSFSETGYGQMDYYSFADLYPFAPPPMAIKPGNFGTSDGNWRFSRYEPITGWETAIRDTRLTGLNYTTQKNVSDFWHLCPALDERYYTAQRRAITVQGRPGGMTREQHQERLRIYLNNARHAVWTVEAARAVNGIRLPSWWKAFALSWGVPVLKDSQFELMRKRGDKLRESTPFIDVRRSLIYDSSGNPAPDFRIERAKWEVLARFMADAAPIEGQFITAERRAFDIPESLKELSPRWMLDFSGEFGERMMKIDNELGSRWWQVNQALEQRRALAATIIMEVIQTVISMGASLTALPAKIQGTVETVLDMVQSLPEMALQYLQNVPDMISELGKVVQSYAMEGIQSVNPLNTFDGGIARTSAVLTRAFDTIPTRLPEFANATPESLFSSVQNKMKSAAFDGYNHIDELAGALMPLQSFASTQANLRHAANVNTFNLDDGGALSVSTKIDSILKNNFSF
jgi:hypothetical protein